MTDRYAVIGNPIAHSKSPQIHSAFAKQTGQDICYEALLAPIDAFTAHARAFFNAGGKGLNITVPFKLQAWQLAEERTTRAEMAGSVNTLILTEQNCLLGENTDGLGLVNDILQNHEGDIEGTRLLILGAGGAVRGVLGPMLEQQPKSVVIANRTFSKAEQLAKLFAGTVPVSASSFEELAGQQFDLVINGTAASLQGELPPLPEKLLANGAWCYDMMYGATDTVFCQWAKQQGAAKALDGLGMLVEQAAESFYLWRGVRPETQPVIEQLRSQL